MFSSVDILSSAQLLLLLCLHGGLLDKDDGPLDEDDYGHHFQEDPDFLMPCCTFPNTSISISVLTKLFQVKLVFSNISPVLGIVTG